MNKQVVIITGASKGIGRETVNLLLSEGYMVVCCYFSALHYPEEFMNENILANNSNTLFIQGDLRRMDVVKKIIKLTISKFGRIDGLVNNAGVFSRKYINDINYSDYLDYIKLMQITPLLLIKECVPYLRKSELGKIVNISSFLAITGYNYSSHYTSCKAAIIGLTKGLAQELAPSITVNCVVPGYIETTNLKKDTIEDRKNRIGKIPLQRIGQPIDVANVIEFLLSNKANYITGGIIEVTGGM